MAWDYERSRERVNEEWDRLQRVGINIQPLTREMDLSNLSPTDARLVHGVHLYANIHNFAELFEDPLLRRDNYKRLYRLLHVAHVELRRIMQSVFEGDKIQAQGPKFHGLLFRPYDDDGKMGWHGVVSAMAMAVMIEKAVPAVFDGYPALVPCLGLELGDTVVANIGVRGDRELISVGGPANHAAKIMTRAHSIHIGERLYSSLSKDQQALFTQNGTTYRLNWSKLENPARLVHDTGFNWSVEQSTRKMKEELDALPLDEIEIADARERIELDRLSPRNARQCFAASIFVDIDGYTRLIDSLRQDVKQLGKAVQLLHLFRYELRQVAYDDYNGLPIQHQGDRLQAILQVPAGDEETIKREAVNMIISHNSSVEEIINKEHHIFGPLHVAIGCASGKAVVGRLGVRGDMDAICIGDGTLGAEDTQLGLRGNQLGITPAVYGAIADKEVKAVFHYQKETDLYLAQGATWTSIEDKGDALAYAAGAAAVFAAGSILIGRQPAAAARPLKVTRPWSP